MLASAFSYVLNMSLTASIVILVVCLARLVLKKVPKIYSYMLWGLVLFRLLCPVSFLSSFSLIPIQISSGAIVSNWEDDYVGDVHIYHDNRAEYAAAIEAGREPISAEEGHYYVVTGDDGISEPDTIENTVLPMVARVWFIGMSSMFAASAVSYGKLRKRVEVCVPLRKGIYIADDINTPFVMGFIRPVIYLPGTLNRDERKYIISHERHHIRRGDHIFKTLGFLALAIHWFNPLVWVAFVLASRDMEMSCDEAVIRKLGEDVRADYSASLLNLATGHRLFAGTPLAFGEGNPTGRVRNLAKWKKPAFWVVLLCMVLCVALAVGLLTNPKAEPHKETISFADIPYDTVTMVELKNLHNGQYTHLFDQMEIGIICDFLKDISGTYAGSGKGYYEGTYQIQLFQNNAVIFSIGFGDSNSFNYGKGIDGYPNRYEPVGTSITQIVSFLSQFDTSGFEWDLPDTPVAADEQEPVNWGVSIRPERVSRTGATAIFVYDNSVLIQDGVELLYGDLLNLERLDENGNWVVVEELPGYRYFVGDSSYPVVDGYGMVHEWQDRFGELPDGLYRLGKSVTLARPDGSGVTRMIYGEFSIPESILTGPIPLEDLPDKYSAEQAMIDGCMVCPDGIPRDNVEQFRDFVHACNMGEAGFFRVVYCYYGDDPSFVVHDIHFDGRKYIVNNMEIGDGRISTYEFPYLKHFKGSKEQEDYPYDAYEYYVFVQDNYITWQEIFDGKYEGKYMPIFINHIYYPKMPKLPENPAKAILEFEGETLVTITDFDRLEKIWILFQEADVLGYEPKTHSTGLGLHLILTGADGNTIIIDLDPDNDICRINGEFIFYGAYDEPCYIEKLWYYLDISQWPEAVYQKYPNTAYRT